jgi:sn1-specific diacylglycerol lipase
LTGTVVDYGLFGGRSFAGPVLSSAVSSALSIMEQLTLAPILLSESLASTSFTAAFSSLNLLSTIFPDSEEASFSLASFVQLIRREWTDPAGKDALPEKRYSAVQVAKALMAWAALQGLTSQWQEKRWFKYLKEIPRERPIPHAHPSASRVRANSRLHVTTDVIFPGRRGQIIAADIGEVSSTESSTTVSPRDNESDAEIKLTLRRLSKLVLAGYGGASLVFFGISPSAFFPSVDAKRDESKLADAVDASEADPGVPSTAPKYSWWNMILGRHDQEIFHTHAKDSPGDSPVDAIVGDQCDMPRFWVLCDHRRHQVVLVIRGNRYAIILAQSTISFLYIYFRLRNDDFERLGCRPYLRSGRLYTPRQYLFSLTG